MRHLWLQQLASHGLFDVNVHATGDTWIDDHHTCEDIALALGTALSQVATTWQPCCCCHCTLQNYFPLLALGKVDLLVTPVATTNGSMPQALGDRKGISRFGNFTAPLDEALIHVVLVCIPFTTLAAVSNRR